MGSLNSFVFKGDDRIVRLNVQGCKFYDAKPTDRFIATALESGISPSMWYIPILGEVPRSKILIVPDALLYDELEPEDYQELFWRGLFKTKHASKAVTIQYKPSIHDSNEIVIRNADKVLKLFYLKRKKKVIGAFGHNILITPFILAYEKITFIKRFGSGHA